MSLPSVLRSLGVTILLITLIPPLAPCQVTKEQNKIKSPKEKLMNIMYVGYFLPEGMRDIFAEDGWRNVRQDCIYTRSPKP